MGYTSAKTNTLMIGWGSTNPNDTTTYIFLTKVNPLTAGALGDYWRNVVSYTITKIYLYCFATGGNFTDEAISVNYRNISDGTNYPLGNFTKTGAGSDAATLLYTTPITIPANKACYFNLTTPAWVTNPTGLIMNGYIEFIEHD